MSAQLSIFGGEVTERQRRKDEPKGYAKPPGSGPAGETCGTCAHAVKVRGGRRAYWKCAVIRHRWTHGPGTDIRLKTPACSMWAAAPGGAATGGKETI
ncbi:MAG: hypothetical protein AB1705_15425 [Verrucomicrobiota bacterium]